MTAGLYEQVVQVTEEYLGPAAQRFVGRQIEFHLKKLPAEVQKADINKLAEWIKVSLALLTEDKKMVDDCVGRIKALGKASSPTS